MLIHQQTQHSHMTLCSLTSHVAAIPTTHLDMPASATRDMHISEHVDHWDTIQRRLLRLEASFWCCYRWTLEPEQGLLLPSIKSFDAGRERDDFEHA